MSRNRTNASRSLLAVTELEDRATPAAAPYAVGVDDGQAGNAVVYNADGTVKFQVAPYGTTFTGGVRVALADVTGDGVADLVTAPGPGTAPVVDVYDGTTGALVVSFSAYESTFTGGLYVAAADLTGDGKAEIITGADQGGGPRVRVFDGATVAAASTTPTVLDDFLAIADPNFRGGVRLAVGDINGDGVADLLVGAGYGGGPRVAGYDGASLGKGEQVKLFADFYAYESTLRNGIYVGVGDVNGDGKGDLIFGGGPGGGPRVRVLSGADLTASGTQTQLANYFAGDPSSRDGVRVGSIPSSATGGTDQVVAVDVATQTASTYGTDGQSTGTVSVAAGDPAGFFACAPFSGFGSGSGTGTGGTTTGGTTTSVATHFLVVTDPQAYAGGQARVTVVALDASNHQVQNYTGTVHLTDTDTGTTLPADYTFTAADRGSHTFTITPSAVGTETVTATDTATATITGSADLTVSAAPVATHLAVVTRPGAYAGAPTEVVVAALDANNHVVPTYTGTVHFTDTDTGATLPADYTFTAADKGVHTFTITPSAVGTETVTATDGATATVTGSADLTVTTAPVVTQIVVVTRSGALAGQPTQVVVAALDADGHVVPTYTGTVHLTSSDAAATLPADYTFTAADVGAHAFTVTLATTGSQTITATDVADPTFTYTTTVKVR